MNVFGICPACQEEYKKVDFDRIHLPPLLLTAPLMSDPECSHRTRTRKAKQPMRALGYLLMIACSCRASLAADLNAVNFGIKADSKTDDGPAIIKMVEMAREQKGPVRLVFPGKQIIYAATGVERYLFHLRDTEGVTIDGGGSTFLLHPDIRFANLEGARRPLLKNLNVDFAPHPFIETIIESVDPKRRFLDVCPLHPEEIRSLGGPTKQDGEQWFGGFVWCENGENPKAARHYTVKSVTLQEENGRARIFYDGSTFSRELADRIIPGATRFSVPRPGVAHRHGPGALFEIHDTVDARLEAISVWGAPWFVFSIYRNEGALEFVDVDVEPKPGTDRLMAACRDAFHVTGNRAGLLFDGCDTAGLGDDDYNFCILSSAIRKVLSPTEIVIRQKFPIQYNPMRVGETLVVMNRENSVIGSATIAGYEEKLLKDNEPICPGGRCPEVAITLQTAINNLEKGLTVWTKEAANPDTTMRDCTCSFSCRMQTSLTVERCILACYNVSYGLSARDDNVEGPGPERMRIVESTFLAGRGSGYDAQCGGAGLIESTRIQEIAIERCTFRAPLKIRKARTITLKDNSFHDGMTIGDYEKLEMTGNMRDGKPFEWKK